MLDWCRKCKNKCTELNKKHILFIGDINILYAYIYNTTICCTI